MAKILVPFLLLVLSFFSWRVLLAPGYFSMHDIQQVARLYELDKALTAGQFPVRWVEGLGFGFGYPLFNFYPPFVYYLGEIIHKFGLGFIDSIKVVWFLALLGSGFSMYYFVKILWGKVPALVAAIFYLYAPYHAVDAFVRGALAELFSFVWLPLILLSSYKQKPLLTGIFLGLLMITHNLIFLPFVPLWILWNIGLNFKQNYFKSIILPLIIAFGLTAFFWLPSLSEKHFTLVDQLLTKDLASYRIHYVCPRQLWDSPWGFGGSAAGCVDGISLKVGKIHLLGSLAALLLALLKRSRVITVSALLLFLSLFLTTDFSSFLWDKISLLWYLQFPWRFLEFASLFSSLAVAGLVFLLPRKSLRIAAAAILLATIIFREAPHFTPQTLLKVTDKDLTSPQEISWNVSSTSFEYLPQGLPLVRGPLGNLLLDIKESDTPRQKYVLSPKALVKTISEPAKFELEGNFLQATKLQLNTVYFPVWQAFLDGKMVKIDYANTYHLITLIIPAGNHHLLIRFVDTPVRKLANLVSAISVLGFGAALLYGTRRSKS